MEIIIKRPNNDDLLEQNVIRWRLFAKKSIELILLYAFLGAIILGANWMSLKQGDSFWGFESSFGIGILLLSLFYFIHNYKNKIKFLARTKEILSKYKNENNGIEIRINETTVSYKDFDIYSELRWTVFTQYEFYKDYLILVMDSQYLTSIFVNRSEISEGQFTELFEFVKTKLPERRR